MARVKDPSILLSTKGKSEFTPGNRQPHDLTRYFIMYLHFFALDQGYSVQDAIPQLILGVHDLVMVRAF